MKIFIEKFNPNWREEYQKYVDSGKFNKNQLRYIEMGFEMGLDVTEYADPKFSADDMHDIMHLLQQGRKITGYQTAKQRSEKWYPEWHFVESFGDAILMSRDPAVEGDYDSYYDETYGWRSEKVIEEYQMIDAYSGKDASPLMGYKLEDGYYGVMGLHRDADGLSYNMMIGALKDSLISG